MHLAKAETVFTIRYTERKIDQLIDTAILEHSPLPAEFQDVQFESDWSFLRSLKGKKKTPTSSAPQRNGHAHTPVSNTRPPSPGLPSSRPASPTMRGFSSLRQSFSINRSGPVGPSLQSLFPDPAPSPHPADIIAFFDALQTLMTLSGVNPVLITQMWSQVLYWMACTTALLMHVALRF